MGVYHTKALDAATYNTQLKSFIKGREALGKSVGYYKTGTLSVGFGYDITSRRSNPSQIISDLTTAGVALSGAQQTAIQNWGAGVINDAALMAQLNGPSGLVDATQADALLNATLPQYEKTLNTLIANLDSRNGLGGALVQQFSGPSWEKVYLVDMSYVAGKLYSGVTTALLNDDAAALAFQLNWQYSSVHSQQGGYLAGSESRAYERASNIIQARQTNTTLYPGGMTAAQKQAFATQLAAQYIQNNAQVVKAIAGMKTNRSVSASALADVNARLQSRLNSIAADLGGGFQLLNKDGAVTLVIPVGGAGRTPAQWAQVLGISPNAFLAANSTVFGSGLLAGGSYRIPTREQLNIAAAMDKAIAGGQATAPTTRQAYDSLYAATKLTMTPPKCFAAGTAVLMADGQEQAIETIRAGDMVMAFEGLGPLEPRRVVQTHVNTTESFLLLNGRTLVTPGHFVLGEDGAFRQVEHILAEGGQLVGAHAEPVEVAWTRQQAQAPLAVNGAAAPELWATYNLTVEGLHTYVADGLRVHNDSTIDLLEYLGGTYESGGYDYATDTNTVTGSMPDGAKVTIVGQDVNGDGVTDGLSYTFSYPDGTRRVGRLKSAADQYANREVSVTTDYNWRTTRPVQMSALLQQVGSTLGSYIGNGDPLASIAGSALLSTVGQRIGAAMDANRLADASKGFSQVYQDSAATFGQDLKTAFQGAAIGSASSAIALELGNAIGLRGFGAELFQTGSSTVLNVLLNNANDIAHGVVGANLFNGFNTENLFGNVLSPSDIDPAAWHAGALSSAIGAFLGAKLGSLIVQPTTQAGVVLSSLGSSVGAFMTGVGAASSGAIGTFAAGLASQLGQLGNFIVPGLGALVGFVMGALIGNLFGHKKPKIPTASAETILQVPFARYELGSETAANGGNVDLVTAMATEARDTLNATLGLITGNNPTALVSNLNGLLTDQRYGHTGSQLYVKVNGVQTNVTSADEAVDVGVLAAIRNTKVIGGNLFLKRAIALSKAINIATLMGDLQAASDYADYLANRDTINAVLGAQPTSAFAAGYMAVAARADELGLNRWNVSDFYGGLKGFVDSFDPGRYLLGYEDFTLSGAGGGLTLSTIPTSAAGGFFHEISSTPGGLSATIDNFLGAGVGYTAWTGVSNMGGNNYADISGATSGQLLSDIGSADGSVGGDDIALGSAYADTLQGRTGNDWLDGGAGNDVLTGGQDQDVLQGGAGDDQLYGDKGDDYVTGGAGNDLHYGGDGNDTFSGKGGADTMSGEAGDDVFIVNGDGGTTLDQMDGGLGNDVMTYERFAGPVSVDLRTGGYYGDTWTAMEGLAGSAFNDSLIGNDSANTLKGSDGDDMLQALGGDDTIEGGLGADRLDGGLGVNTASYADSTGGVFVDLTDQEAVGGDAEGDSLVAIANLTGSRMGDDLRGDAGANLLKGLDGDDRIIATAGSDTYDGGAGYDFVDYANATAGVYLDLGSTLASAPANGAGYGGMAAGQTLTSLEGVMGSAYGDTLYGQAGDQTFIGGGGADYLAGGAGSDTYVFSKGDGGVDTVQDDNTASNTVSLSGADYNDIFFGSSGSPSTPTLNIRVISTGEGVDVANNFRFDAARNVVKSFNIDGVGQIEIGNIDFGLGGSDFGDYLYGTSAHYDWLMSYNGDDVLYGAWGGSGAVWEDKGNVTIAGGGADTIYTSVGDDQFVFERGNGRDFISDTGGEDTIVFGPTVAADDVIYQVVNADLYVGLRDDAQPELKASQVADQIRIFGGGVKHITDSGNEKLNTVEFVNAGGAWIDLRKVDVDWTIIYDPPPGGGGGVIPPIVFDLDGDGLNLSSVTDTSVVVKGEDGQLSAIGWAGPTEGVLAVDRNGDKVIDRLSEISFTQDKTGATSDLDGLSAWDSNGDGVLNDQDARFGELLMWVDEDQNGQGAKKELRSLKDAGIAAIDLKGQPTGYTSDDTFDNFVQNRMSATRADGTTVNAYDVALATVRLGSDGYDGSAVAGDGQLGALLNDPVKAAKDAARANGRPATYDDVRARAQVDFTGLAPNARGLDRWARKPQAKEGEVGGAGQREFDALVASRQGRPAKAADALALAADGVLDADADFAPMAAFETAGPPVAGDSGDGTLAASLGAAPAAEDPLIAPLAAEAPPSNGLAERPDWWRNAAPLTLGYAADGLGASGAPAGYEGLQAVDASGAADSGSIDPLRQQLLLRQAVAGFGGDAGGSAAVWLRTDPAAATPLAAETRAQASALQRWAA